MSSRFLSLYGGLACLTLVAIDLAQPYHGEASAWCDEHQDAATVAGYVADMETGIRIPSVQIWTPPKGEIRCGTLSDSFGYFSMTLGQGDHQLGVAGVGYCLAAPVEARLQKNDTIQVEVALQMLNGPSPASAACKRAQAEWRGQ